MQVELPEPVCECGSAIYVIHCRDYTATSTGIRWTTRKERAENPDWKQVSCQPCICVYDEEWITCLLCKKELSRERVDYLWESWKKRHPEWKPGPWKIIEEVGEVIVNDYVGIDDIPKL